MATKIVKCNCVSEYQDGVHGNGNRLHNFAAKNGSWRCTVCGNEKAAPKEKLTSAKEVKKK